MKKDRVLYICRKYLPSRECSEWYEEFKSVLLQGETINMAKNSIETPYVIIDFVRRRPLFTAKYDIVLKSSKQDDDAKLFALGIGKDY